VQGSRVRMVVESRPHHQMRGSGGTSSGGNRWEQVGNRCVLWLQVRKPCGNLSLSIGVATESEVADTEGGTATDSPL
jgi:hypothetical protein